MAVDRALARRRSRRLRKWLIRLGILSAVVLVIGFFMWRSRPPTVVTVVQPKLTTITETIASSGRVGGETETLVGPAQLSWRAYQAADRLSQKPGTLFPEHLQSFGRGG